LGRDNGCDCGELVGLREFDEIAGFLFDCEADVVVGFGVDEVEERVFVYS
jgi:hypothetical protein